MYVKGIAFAIEYMQAPSRSQGKDHRASDLLRSAPRRKEPGSGGRDPGKGNEHKQNYDPRQSRSLSVIL